MAKYAHCIGINDNPGTGSDVSGCVFDAIRKALPSQQYPQTPNLSGTKSVTAWKLSV